jgi:hypothetical protein
MGSFGDFFRAPLSFLFPHSRKEEVCAEHLIREHHRGRSLDEIMKDAYITNRLSPEQAKRLLDRPDVLHAFGEDIVSQHRTAAEANGNRTLS